MNIETRMFLRGSNCLSNLGARTKLAECFSSLHIKELRLYQPITYISKCNFRFYIIESKYYFCKIFKPSNITYFRMGLDYILSEIIENCVKFFVSPTSI